MLIDSGASVTLMDLDFYRNNGFPQWKVTCYVGSALISANGSPLSVHGEVLVDFNLGGLSFNHSVTLVEDLSTKVILGTDILRKMEARIDLGRWEVVIAKEGKEVSIHLLGKKPLKEASGQGIRAPF